MSSRSQEPKQVGAGEIDRVLAEEVLLLDVREPSEIASLGAIEGSLNIPIGQLESRLGEIPRGRPILTA